jgi:uncharacterized membrane-anchored protein
LFDDPEPQNYQSSPVAQFSSNSSTFNTESANARPTPNAGINISSLQFQSVVDPETLEVRPGRPKWMLVLFGILGFVGIIGLLTLVVFFCIKAVEFTVAHYIIVFVFGGLVALSLGLYYKFVYVDQSGYVSI